ncbi:unnamed protein product [Gordionus sp. m RMFG-2023]
MPEFFKIFLLLYLFNLLDYLIFKYNIISRYLKPSLKYKDIYKEVLKLESEKRNINVVDEFPNFARLQRKINAHKEDIEKIEKDQKQQIKRYKTLLKYIIYTMKILLSLYYIWQYYSKILVAIPKEWLFPCYYFLPKSIQSGNIYIIPWLFLSEEASKALINQMFITVFNK